MDAPGYREDIMVFNTSSSSATAAVLKRKRTKRPPPHPTAASTPTSSVDLSEEEEDMAHCLILLARGRALGSPSRARLTSRRLTETATAAGGRAGSYVYECKTCNKCFPSFQALGGHRTSHKKPKPASDQETKQYQQPLQIIANNVDTFTSDSVGNIKQLRTHECSICGSEFSSGQALGGHMRRHRPAGAPPPERNVLSLDLNLPAPPDDNAAAFHFADKRPMVFSPASAIVDCHV